VKDDMGECFLLLCVSCTFDLCRCNVFVGKAVLKQSVPYGK
jgi:hypothetical protein